eukprot:1158730-Pelagomonas_calceolata.AAC.13
MMPREWGVGSAGGVAVVACKYVQYVSSVPAVCAAGCCCAQGTSTQGFNATTPHVRLQLLFNPFLLVPFSVGCHRMRGHKRSVSALSRPCSIPTSIPSSLLCFICGWLPPAKRHGRTGLYSYDDHLRFVIALN